MALFLFVHLAIAYVFGIAWALLDIRSNGYAALDFWRSIWLTLLDATLTCGAAGLAGALGFVVMRSLLIVLWPPSQRLLSIVFLVRCLHEFRLTLSLFAASLPIYLVCRGGSWKIGALCAILWIGMILVLAILVRVLDAPSRARSHGPLAACFFSGAFLIVSLGAMDPHSFQGYSLNATNIYVALALVATATAYFILLVGYYRAVERYRPNQEAMRPGRAMVAVAIVVCLSPLAPWIALRFQSVPENLIVKNPKNVIILAIDTLRADHTTLLQDEGVVGRDYTPNLRNLARRGVVFESAISQAPWTMPSFASVLTGKYPDEHGAVSIAGYLRAAQLTVAEVLREAGYQTAAIVSHTYVDSEHGFDQGFTSFNEDNALGHDAITSTALTDEAMRFLENGRNKDNFFLFLHYFDPHNVYHDHAEYNFADEYAGWLKKERMLRDINQLRKFRHLLNAEDLKYLDDLYSEEISHTDVQIGRLLAYLEENNLSDDTAIIIVTDHGEEFMERGWLGHSIGLYDELIHVPLLCVLPGVDATRGQVSNVVETRGVFDLVLQYLGISNPDIAGDSNLLKEIRSPEEAGSETSIAFSTVGLSETPVGAGDGLHVSSARTREWKFIADYTLNREFLYQLSSDPGETENVIDRFPEQADSMRKSLNDWMRETTGNTEFAPRMEMNKDQTESLKALGYL